MVFPSISIKDIPQIFCLFSSFMLLNTLPLTKSSVSSIVSFDMIVETMKYTGQKIAMELRETSLGGLAEVVPCKKPEGC